MNRYLYIIEQTENNYSAYSPDFPGCVATGSTISVVENNMKKAIELHLNGIKEDSQSLPQPHSYAGYVSVD